ncbi:PepSY domain-containing protein [Paraglaciecola sp.]|uniref:PepSY domain-containing protein n=1 Tax=Paraglaciecola sp. TaxID=1920173 RepID=UPI0035565C9F
MISLLLLSNSAVADDKKQTQAPKTKSEAAQQAQQKVNGRVLKVEQNQTTYRVKVLQKSGRVVSVDVDKKSGKVSKEKKD